MRDGEPPAALVSNGELPAEPDPSVTPTERGRAEEPGRLITDYNQKERGIGEENPVVPPGVPTLIAAEGVTYPCGGNVLLYNLDTKDGFNQCGRNPEGVWRL